MERHPKNGSRRINNPFPPRPTGLGFVKGDLLFNAEGLPTQSHTAGQGFEVRWQVDHGGALQVVHSSEPSRILWSTVAGQSFVSAALGRDSFEESRGSLAIHDRVDNVCSHQSVEHIALAWPSETLMLRKESLELHQKLARRGEFEKNTSLESQFTPRSVDADGAAVGNRGPSVIVSGCLYTDRALAAQQLSAFATFCSSSPNGHTGRPRGWPGPFYIASERSQGGGGGGRNGDRGCVPVFSTSAGQETVGVRYWLQFYEAREHQLGFSVSLGQPVRVERGSSIAAATLTRRRRRSSAAVLPAFGDGGDSICHHGQLELPHFHHRRHWLWSDTPLSAFAPPSPPSSEVAAAAAPLLMQRRSISVGDFRTSSLTESYSMTPTVPYFLPGLKTSAEGFSVRRFHDDEEQQFQQLPKFNRLQITYSSTREERFFGFGEQFSHFDLKGRRVPIIVQEQGIGRGDQPVTALANLVSNRSGGDWHTTYAPVPYYITSEMRSLYLEGYEYAVFDLTQHDAVQLQVHSGFVQGRILQGQTPTEIIERYTAATGRMRELPGWILKGAIVGMQGGAPAVKRVWQQLRELDVPLAAFWLQDWVGQRRTSIGWQLWWNWEVDRDHYPDWEGLVQELRRHGIRTMAYCNPLLAPSHEKPNRKRDLLDEAHTRGFVVGDNIGATYMIPNTSFDAAMVDLTNPAARSWLKSVLHDMVQTGIRGWMADFGEALPLDSSLFSGEDARVVHNKYPELWAELNREFAEEWEKKQKEDKKATRASSPGVEDGELQDEDETLVFFTRAGYRGSPRWSTLFWEGDQMVSWQRNDGIKSAVTGLLTGGLCGYSMNHSDIGGYCTVDVPLLRYRRTEELLLRWMELNAFSTIFRTHEGNVPSSNSQFYSNERTLRHFARFARVYKAWEFYRRFLVKEAAATGLPVVRHMFVHYPHDQHVHTFTYQQFLVGTEFLVVPVVDKGRRRVEAYFPRPPPAAKEEAWEHVWTGKVYTPSLDQGLKAWVDAPMGEPAVFTRKGSSVGLQFRENLFREGIPSFNSVSTEAADRQPLQSVVYNSFEAPLHSLID